MRRQRLADLLPPAFGKLQACELDTNRIETMSYTVSTLLLRNLHDVFGEIDPVRRRAAIDEIFHEDAVFHEPNGIYRGRDEINRIAGVIKATHPDFQYQLIAPPEELGDGGRVRWVEGGPGKPPAVAGTDFIIARDGKIAAVDIVLLNHPDLPSLGAGEAALPLVPAAIANAFLNATGKRLRDLPFGSDRIKAALT
jgi:hypothetical protein